ncbi:peptidylprolyl isomerase [Novosphingobium rosa]|uniref:peptidylprolyl isomerase n=1 Tax=Novosphingobium rosa TaxID=76978 RepID=UPI000829F07C|nr:peptidyl-prolyl cis-trans isomerase [Novosphingobium rosa]
MTDTPRLDDLHSHSEKRTLIFCAAGAVLGLVVAGTGLFTAQGTRIAGVPPEDVATVNQVPILMSDYVTALQASESVGLDKASPAQKRKVLGQMIREELYVQRGVELGLQNDVIEVRQALVSAVEGQQAVDAASTQPDDATLRDQYNRHIDKYTGDGLLTVSDFIAPDMVRAQAAVATLRAGGHPSGVKPSDKVADGEEFYFAARIHLGDRLFETAKALRSGQVSAPIQLPDGVHVLLVKSNIAPVVTPFEQARDRVLTDYRSDKVSRMQAGADAYLRKRADVQIAPGFE